MDESQEYPALRILLANLQSEMHSWQGAYDRDKWEPKPDPTIAVRLAEVKERWSELDRALRRLEHTDESKIGVSMRTLLAIGIANGGFLALILYLLFIQN